MSFLFRKSKKKLIGNNQKIPVEKANKDYHKKLVSGIKNHELDLSKLYSNLKEYQIYSPKYQTLKSSRKSIFFI